MQLAKNDFFHTPADSKELWAWIDQHNGSEKTVAITAAAMAWNLAAELTNDKEIDHAVSE